MSIVLGLLDTPLYIRQSTPPAPKHVGGYPVYNVINLCICLSTFVVFRIMNSLHLFLVISIFEEIY